MMSSTRAGAGWIAQLVSENGEELVLALVGQGQLLVLSTQRLGELLGQEAFVLAHPCLSQIDKELGLGAQDIGMQRLEEKVHRAELVRPVHELEELLAVIGSVTSR
jgi:hypothetical protein